MASKKSLPPSIWIVAFLLIIGAIILTVCLTKSKRSSSKSEEFRRYQSAYPDGYGPAANRFMGVPVPKGALKDTSPKYKVAETAAAYGIPFNVALGKAPLQYFDQFGGTLLNGRGVQERNFYPNEGYTPSVTDASVAFTDLGTNVPTAGVQQRAWNWRMPTTQTPFFTPGNWNSQPLYGTTPWNNVQYGIRSNPYDRMSGGITATNFFYPWGPNWVQSQSVPFISSVNSYAPMPRVPGNFEKVGLLTKVGSSGSGKDILNLFQKPIAPLQDLFEYQVENKNGFVIPIDAKYLEDGDTVANVSGLGGPWKVNLFNQNKYVYM